MNCPECRRRFRSAHAAELYRRRKAVIESLRTNSPCAHLAPFDLDRPERHRIASKHFKQHGEGLAA